VPRFDDLELEIRRQLIAYLVGNVPLVDFEAWFISRTWELPVQATALSNFARGIEGRLAEYSASELEPEDELRESLFEFLSSVPKLDRDRSSLSSPVVHRSWAMAA
jgi:hypothetical protein